MTTLPAILVILLVVAAVFLYLQYREMDALKGRIHGAESATDEKKTQLESAKTETREKRDELERLRSELADVKGKLRKQEKQDGKVEGGKKNRNASSKPEEAAAEPAHVAVVRVSNEQFEAQAQAKLDALEAKLKEAESEIEVAKKRERDRDARDQRARAEIEAKKVELSAGMVQAASDDPAALKTQMEAIQRASGDRENDLKKELRRMESDLRAAEKRSQANHQLYQVVKGQLQVTEDRMAALRKKHEGARSPEFLRKEVDAPPNAALAPAPEPEPLFAAAPEEPLLVASSSEPTPEAPTA